jgi:hypothetical protein
MEGNCIGSHSPQRTVVLEKKKKNGGIRNYNRSQFICVTCGKGRC